jgi:O-antigen biosynthesis protein
MTQTVSVIIPVKDGARWLAETLAAVTTQRDDGVDVLVVDSGSSDGSVAIARAAGARVLQIASQDFGHGRTRNLAAEQAEGDLLCFLTQDAMPCPGWLDAYREAMAIDPLVGAAFGPHLPRGRASPMIAREMHDFFAGFGAPDGRPSVFPSGEAPFISNVNACYRRSCWSDLRFQDVPYAEDRAFARELAGSGWLLAYHPGAAVLHSHDFGPVTFIRRYFDEYRSLRAVEGFVEPFGVRSKWPEVRTQVARDRGWMRAAGVTGSAFRAWSARSLFHHATRKAAMVAGTHPERIPALVQQAISLERGPLVEAPRAPRVVPSSGPTLWEPVLKLARDGPAPLVALVPGMAQAERLHIAVVIPPFGRNSGGHGTIFRLLGPLEERGHTVTTWLYDPGGRMVSKWPAVLRAELREFFGAPRGPVFSGFGEWFGADVVLATGWETAYPVMTLERCRARAYLVQDHEPEFFPTSAESVWAEASYAAGPEPIAVSPWLADLVAPHVGAVPPVVDLGVDHETYRVQDVRRRSDTVIFYARDATARRAVPLGILALGELHRRRPNTRFVLFGQDEPLSAPFPYDHVGVASPAELADHYAVATVGLCLSLTYHSLVPHEMLACGLPCVELAGISLERVHGPDGPLVLAEPDPLAIADALERLLEDPAERARRAEAGVAAVAWRTWDRASRQLESALRDILRRRA